MSPELSIPDQFRRQAGWCERLGSPLYSHLFSRCADDYEQSGPVHDLLRTHESDAESSALPLRLAGTIHRLVLEGREVELARFYPSVGGTVELNGAWQAFRNVIRERRESVGRLVQNPVQTNEVGRSGSLLGGFGLIADRTRLPLRLLEIGTSAGLNLRWDRYRYEWPGGAWGDAASSVRIENVFVGQPPLLPSTIDVIERAGCDPCPVDIGSESGRLTLLSYTWADQLERIHRLEAALEIGCTVPCTVEKEHGADWIEERLRKPFSGAATVVFHSAVWQYISEPEKQRIITAIEDAGKRASPQAPVAWLRMEAPINKFEIRLRIDPGFEEQIIATSRAHAPAVRWLIGPR
ncbi:MAG TPA: DUF2332 domain-containing protein [Blastocatellia bacterium]|nr:DUF2332 domain-containing protein [Blastocatellia bacterium]